MVITLLGCTGHKSGLQIDGSTHHSVLFGDSLLTWQLKVDEVATTQVDGRARGVVRLTSHHSDQQSIRYRFYWYDDNGLEVNSKPGPCRHLVINGMETVAISEVSVNPNGTQFRVQVYKSNR